MENQRTQERRGNEMSDTNRIPGLRDQDKESMDKWFFDMAEAGLIFHPEDSADSIVKISDGTLFFSPEEAESAQRIMDELYDRFGGDAVVESAYPHFMRAAGHGD